MKLWMQALALRGAGRGINLLKWIIRRRVIAPPARCVRATHIQAGSRNTRHL